MANQTYKMYGKQKDIKCTANKKKNEMRGKPKI